MQSPLSEVQRLKYPRRAFLIPSLVKRRFCKSSLQSQLLDQEKGLSDLASCQLLVPSGRGILSTAVRLLEVSDEPPGCTENMQAHGWGRGGTSVSSPTEVPGQVKQLCG